MRDRGILPLKRFHFTYICIYTYIYSIRIYACARTFMFYACTSTFILYVYMHVHVHLCSSCVFPGVCGDDFDKLMYVSYIYICI